MSLCYRLCLDQAGATGTRAEEEEAGGQGRRQAGDGGGRARVRGARAGGKGTLAVLGKSTLQRKIVLLFAVERLGFRI